MEILILRWLISLLLVFQIKHFLADYPFQGKYMLGKFKGGTEWILPLLAHASVHAAFTFIIAFVFSQKISTAFWLGVLDLVIHFTMDRIKASPNLLGRFKPDNKYFWWALGFDQMVHHVTHYFIILCLIGDKLL
jgi:hypothetical protein